MGTGCRLVVIGVGLACWTPQGAEVDLAAAAPPTASTGFELSRHGEIVVAARLNGGRRVHMLLDTGSSHSAISAPLAHALKLPAVARTTVTTELGEAACLVVRVDRLELGDIEVGELLPSVLPRDAIDPSGQVEGLIGQDVLASRRYTIDYRARRIFWNGDAPPLPRSGAADLPMTFEDGRFLIDVPQHAGTLRLVPDSGAEGLVLFADAAASMPVARSDGRISATALAGAVDAEGVRLRTFVLGSLTLSDVSAAIIQPTSRPRKNDGLLPLHLFARVTLDGPRRRLTIERR